MKVKKVHPPQYLKKPIKNNFPDPGGQPTKYKTEFCDRVKKFMSQGYSFQAFSAEVGVNQDTLYEWRHVHKDFSEAVKVAQEMSRRALETIMLANATGKMRGSPAAAIFLMKNRFPKEWRDRQEIALADTPAPVTVELDNGRTFQVSVGGPETNSISDSSSEQ